MAAWQERRIVNWVLEVSAGLSASGAVFLAALRMFGWHGTGDRIPAFVALAIIGVIAVALRII